MGSDDATLCHECCRSFVWCSSPCSGFSVIMVLGEFGTVGIEGDGKGIHGWRAFDVRLSYAFSGSVDCSLFFIHVVGDGKTEMLGIADYNGPWGFDH